MRSRLALLQYELMLCFKDTEAAARKAERAVENLAGVNGTALTSRDPLWLSWNP